MSTEKLKEQARRHEQKEEWIKALDLYKKAIDRLAQEDQPDIGLYNRVGDLFVRVGNLDAAVEHYEQAVDLYVEAELPNNAIAVCKKVIRNVPDRHAIYLAMGQIRANQGFLPDARTNFLTYAERVAQNDDINESLRALTEFTRLAPDDVEVRLFLAEQLAAHDREDEAVEQLVRAHHVLRARGEDEEADAVGARVRELDPDADLDEVPSESDEMVIESGAGFVVETGEAREPRDEEQGDPEEALDVAGSGRGEPSDPETGWEDGSDPGDATADRAEAEEVPGAGEADEAPGEPASVAARLPLLGGREPDEEEGAGAEEEDGFDEEALEESEGLPLLGEAEGTDEEGTTLPGFDGYEDDHEDEYGYDDAAEPLPTLAAYDDGPDSAEGDEDRGAAVSESGSSDDEDADELPLLEGTGLEEDEAAALSTPGDAAEGADPDFLDAFGSEDDEEAEELPLLAGTGSWDDEEEEAADELPLLGVRPSEDEEEEEGEHPDDLPLLGSSDPEADAEDEADREDEADDEDEAHDELPTLAGAGEWDDDEEEEALEELPTLDAGAAGVEGHPEEASGVRGAEEALEGDPGSASREAAEEAAEEAAAEIRSDAPAPDLTAAEVGDRLERERDDLSLHQRRIELAYESGVEEELVEGYLGLARALERRGESVRARAAYQQILEVDPHHPEAREGGRRVGAPEEPVQEVAASEEYVDLGAMILGDAPEKTTRFTVAYEEPSGDEEADFAKMLSRFKDKVSENLDADDVRAHHDLGTAYKEMGLLNEAVAEFQAALRADATHLPTYELMGQTFMEMGRPSQAIRSLERALRAPYQVEDELVGIYYFLARAHEEEGNRDDAIEFYDRVFSLDINFADVTERLRALRPS